MARPQISTRKLVSNEDMEKSIRGEKKIQVVYKYRTWENCKHRESLTNTQIWLSSPKSLNDLYDIRLAYTFDSSEVLTEAFKNKLKTQFPTFSNLTPGTRDFEVSFENHYDLIKKDPQRWFMDNWESTRHGELYDQIGLFSTTTDPEEMLMWAYYGESHKGFCIGYDPFVIFQTMNRVMFGEAIYLNEPIPYSFIEEKNGYDMTDLLIKDKKWIHEKEYRFVTILEPNESRLVTLDKSAIKEVTLGKNIHQKHEDEIKEVLRDIYGSNIRLYKIQDTIRLGLKRVEINY